MTDNDRRLLTEEIRLPELVAGWWWQEREESTCNHEFNEETGYCIKCFDNVHSVREKKGR